MDNLSIPTIDLENYDLPEEEEIAVEDNSGGSLKFAFLGAGQCGSRIADSFYRLGYGKTIVFNTTNQDMKGIDVPTNQRIVRTLDGYSGGAGKDMMVAAEVIDSHRDEVYNLMMNVFGNVDHIFVCAGLGGGTGGGSAAALIEIAKKYMTYLGEDNVAQKVGAIVTLPTQGESSSPVVASNARQTGQKLSALADGRKISPLIIVDNDKIGKMYRKLTMRDFYPTINSSVTTLLHIFNVISTKPSEFITFDSTDFRNTLESFGHLIMGVTTIDHNMLEGKTTIADALRKNLSRTLLASDFDLTSSNCLACICVAGEEEVNKVPGLMENIEIGFDAMANMTGHAKVHRGVYSDPDTVGLRVYTLVGGLDAPKKRYSRLAQMSEGRD